MNDLTLGRWVNKLASLLPERLLLFGSSTLQSLFISDPYTVLRGLHYPRFPKVVERIGNRYASCPDHGAQLFVGVASRNPVAFTAHYALPI
jgi:hypothetical protein